MWSSIKNIDIPKSFKKAINDHSKAKSSFFVGGTYLVAEKDSKIKNVVDIGQIIEKSIDESDSTVSVGAGVSLQSIIDELGHFTSLADSAKFSCSSKNIRNQRTTGGEVAQKRIQSDLFTYLVALNPILEIRNPQKFSVYLREWDGKGIINNININKIDLDSSGIERFATLDSAPAFMIIAVVRRALELDFVVSGKAKKIFGHTINLAEFGKNSIKSMINESVKYFEDDQYGSVEYKKSLIATGIQRAVEQI